MQIVSRAEAAEGGLTRYFTGQPCKHGHICPRYTRSKICVDCAAANRAQWGAANPESVRQGFRRWYDNNPHKWKEGARKWREKNREHKRQANAKWAADNPDKVRHSQREHYRRNLETQRERSREKHRARAEVEKVYGREYRQKFPEKHRTKEARRRAAKARVGGSFTDADIAEIVKLQRGRCAYCKAKLTRKHNDHIICLARGGSNSRRNIQVTCQPCNLSKGAKDPIDFAQSLGLLI